MSASSSSQLLNVGSGLLLDWQYCVQFGDLQVLSVQAPRARTEGIVPKQRPLDMQMAVRWQQLLYGLSEQGTQPSAAFPSGQ
jgi:hypothetical protein